MRKLAERQSYVRKTNVFRNQVNYETGEIKTRKRKVNRRVKWMNGQAGFTPCAMVWRRRTSWPGCSRGTDAGRIAATRAARPIL
jgi:hypothetical protein